MKITRAVVPSLFTTLNIFCGFLAILRTTQGQFHTAAWFIILAAIFDALDGMMARITRSSSQFGVELDSLADVISFGAAPSFMVYQVFLHNFNNWGIIIASMPLVFGAIRLARFNVQLVGFDKHYFNGLSIPMQALTICAFIFEFYSDGGGLSSVMGGWLTILVIILSLLMVSHVRYDTLPKFSKRQISENPKKVVGFLVGVLVIVFSKGSLLFLILLSYVIFGLIRSAWHWWKRVFLKVEKESEEESEFSSIDI
jgi:CDP-diacylglycerol--serine O-phosphatidyltransferase